MKKKILCYGDSNTYGYDPRGYLGGRYPSDVHWAGRINTIPGWEIINHGCNGRSLPRTSMELGELADGIVRHLPDGLCVMLGTNDLLCGASPEKAAERLEVMLDFLLSLPYPLTLLLIAPPALQQGDWVTDPALLDASLKYCSLCRDAAGRNNICFADANAWGIPLAYDGVHFTAEGHRIFAENVIDVFRMYF